jgi:hypothetical protein
MCEQEFYLSTKPCEQLVYKMWMCCGKGELSKQIHGGIMGTKLSTSCKIRLVNLEKNIFRHQKQYRILVLSYAKSDISLKATAFGRRTEEELVVGN